MKTKFCQWLEKSIAQVISHPELRLGQCLMINLAEIDKEMYKDMALSKVDCFYDETRVADTIRYISERWENEK